MVSVLRLTGGWSATPASLFSALIFSLAHAHSCLLRWPPVRPQADQLLQCGFTLIFGLLAGHLMGRTRCVWTVAVCHALANAVGFPDVDRVLALPSLPLLALGAIGGLSAALGAHLLRLL
jgi:membrane protease YdiL (CAAX protease family)